MGQAPIRRRLPLLVCAGIGVYGTAWLVLAVLLTIETVDQPVLVAVPGAVTAIGAASILLATAVLGSRPRPKSTPPPAAIAAVTWPAWVPAAASLVQIFTAAHYGVATTARLDLVVNILLALGLTLVFVRPSLRRLTRRWLKKTTPQ